MPEADHARAAMLAEARALALPLNTSADLDPLVDRVGESRLVCLGEASHGTHEFYQWRARASARLIVDKGFTWIGVEGDWPDCWRINEWVRGRADTDLDSRQLLARFGRWPTWMWANEEVADFLTWLREHNAHVAAEHQVGFYGLDVYSLWDSLRAINAWLEVHAPEALPAARQAWQCFLPYAEDPHHYAWSTRLVPEQCEADVIELLGAVRAHASFTGPDDDAFNAVVNAEVAAAAEHYYRTMVRGDRESWNVRDRHMAATVDRVAQHHGPESRGLVWEHNTHVGDARATDMASAGMVNVGQLLRERRASGEVLLVGFATHHGSVLASDGWGERQRVMTVPHASPGSHEDLVHEALNDSALLLFGGDREGPWLSAWKGHRAIGVVYRPDRELGNYVPTRMGGRYDALVWCAETTALQPLHPEGRPLEPELETEPSGM